MEHRVDVDLDKFCGKNHTGLLKPFSQEGYSWATDGRTIIGVPQLESVLENKSAPNVGLILDSLPKLTGRGLAIPEIKDLPKCKLCGGVGENFECFECKGSGRVELSTEYTEYHPECGSCEGEGEIDLCPLCEGCGFDVDFSVEIGGVKFYGGALLKLQTLPNVRIYPGDQNSIAAIVFNGGKGAIMPQIED